MKDIYRVGLITAFIAGAMLVLNPILGSGDDVFDEPREYTKTLRSGNRSVLDKFVGVTDIGELSRVGLQRESSLSSPLERITEESASSESSPVERSNANRAVSTTESHEYIFEENAESDTEYDESEDIQNGLLGGLNSLFD
jgi:hypothetical protein